MTGLFAPYLPSVFKFTTMLKTEDSRWKCEGGIVALVPVMKSTQWTKAKARGCNKEVSADWQCPSAMLLWVVLDTRLWLQMRLSLVFIWFLISKHLYFVTCASQTVSSISWLAKTSKGFFGVVTIHMICITVMLSCFKLVYHVSKKNNIDIFLVSSEGWHLFPLNLL